MRDHDFDPFFRLLLWATGTKEHSSILRILLKRIRGMYILQGKRRNLKQVYLYLKECYTICVSVKVGSHYDPKMGVRVGRVSGLPLIIPGRLRLAMMSDRRMYVAVMTLLGIHRIIPWWPPVDYSTVIEKFNGSYRTLAVETLIESKRKLCELAGLKGDVFFKNLSAVWLLPESAGPNLKVAWQGVVADAVAILRNPRYLVTISRWLFETKSFATLFSLWATCLISFPLLLGSRIVHIGRLTAVYNTAGKARVIGITNWWTQVALYPLHREIFKFLEGLPTDGTYDQLKPVKALVDNGKIYYSYDLSAATDRLPRDIQKDVLTQFIGNTLSELWAQMVDMPFGLSKEEPDIIRYSVGQPMGAYSSWAMLALTHHMIVQASGPSLVQRYAVLGDDVIVSDDAPKYLELMTGFGVSISMAKSICSNEFIEFAKRVRTIKGEDYSIIGPGLIMSAVRNRFLSAVVLADSLRKDLIRWTAAPKHFLEMPGNVTKQRKRIKPSSRFANTTRTPLDFGSWVLFGPKGLISSNLSFALSEGSVRGTQDLKHESFFFKGQLRKYLEKETLAKWTQSKKKAQRTLNTLTSQFLEVSEYYEDGWALRMFHFVALWLSPIPWLIIARYGETLESVNPWEEKQMHRKYIDDIILEALDGFPELQISSLEALTRQEALNILRFYDGALSYDPDAEVLRLRAIKEREFNERTAVVLRHRKLAACLASGRDIILRDNAHLLVSGTQGPRVPQDSRALGLEPE